MKLPDPEFARGQSSLGRDNMDRTAPAEWAFRSARNTVAGAFAEAFKAAADWDEAEQEATARKRLADYKQKMQDSIIGLSSKEELPVDEIPAGVEFKKTRVDESGTEVPRERVPAWEIAPNFHDQRDKELTKEALHGIGNKKVRAWLENSLAAERLVNSGSVAKFHIAGRKDYLVAQTDAAVVGLVKAGDLPAAYEALDKAGQLGLLSKQQVTKKQLEAKQMHDYWQVAKFIDAEDDPERLRAAGDGVLASKALDLTPAQRRDFAKDADNKATRLEKAKEKAEKDARKESSKRLLGEWTLRLRIDNDKPAREVLLALGAAMEPEDYRSLLVMYDRVLDGGIGNDDEEARRLGLSITGLMSSVPGSPMNVRAESVRKQIDEAFRAGRIKDSTWRSMLSDVDGVIKRGTSDDPTYKAARELLFVKITGFTEQDILTGKVDPVARATAVEAQTALLRARLQDPSIDALAWVGNNLGRYTNKALAGFQEKLRDKGLLDYARYKQDGAIDPQQTGLALKNAWTAGHISDDKYISIMDQLQKVPQ